MWKVLGWARWGGLVAMMCVVSCADDENDSTTSACEPACAATSCMVCDLSGNAPECVSTCGVGLVCEAGVCTAESNSACTADCTSCQRCDDALSPPACVDLCDAGTECDGGRCRMVPSSCTAGCGPCQMCDETAGNCTDVCGSESTCVEGVCQALGCQTACGACEVCAEADGGSICVSVCSDDQMCDAGTCRRETLHTGLTALQGPFADGPAVTEACISCHADEAQDFLATAHWRWLGPTPSLEGHEGESAGVGKINLINNFCVAIESNEPRCSECHAGYGYNGPDFDFEDTGKIDCLVCHADPSAGYYKEVKTSGAAGANADLALAARSVGEPQRANCGACHFRAGGGDNVKKGDMGSALRDPTLEIDAHMGGGMSCADCHRGDLHTMRGLGVHVPISEGRVSCEDCHGADVHTTAGILMGAPLDNHTLDIACQTCHIPTYSQTQATKADWDWSTAGNKTRGNAGIEMGTLADGTEVQTYNFMKGDFIWKKDVQPTYAWYNGGSHRLLTTDTFGTGYGASADAPVPLGGPTSHRELATGAVTAAADVDADAKIFPFKVMTGRTPAHLTGGDYDYMIVPKLFGAGGYWGQIPSADDYPTFDMEQLWTDALVLGARAAAQIDGAASYTKADWGWAYTEMYLGINHEVRPGSEALTCNQCHGSGDFDFTALGYSCDPITNPIGCGSRHR